MAQQTINVGTAPNDGTGTPLRTAFQYTNSNFSELYTAVGPSGNNIVVPGTATITGDLTVRTNKLAVTSTGVGIGTASPAVLFHAALPAATFGEVGRFYDSSGNGISFTANAGSGFNQITSTGAQPLIVNVNSSERYRIASDGVATWSNVGGVAGTAMTLNSTGLGVGVSPQTKIHIEGTSATVASTVQIVGAATSTLLLGQNADGGVIRGQGGNNCLTFWTGGSASTAASGTGTERMRIDSSGNVGIGVTPSALNSSYKGIQVGGSTFLFNNTTGASNSFFYTNAFQDSANNTVYRANGRSSGYLQLNGEHRWYYDSGTQIANANCAFTQAMTLDASGNLLIGTTDTGSNSGVGIKSVYSATAPYVATVGSSTSASQYSYLLYSTGGTPAYKFYVSYSGQISATSGTVAALSDARFKENIQDIDVGLGAILALKPRKFDWKAGKGKDIKGDRGFIAQEFETVFPNLIDEWADPAPEGEAPYKSVRQDLIPVLVKAIQELTARVQTLETR